MDWDEEQKSHFFTRIFDTFFLLCFLLLLLSPYRSFMSFQIQVLHFFYMPIFSLSLSFVEETEGERGERR